MTRWISERNRRCASKGAVALTAMALVWLLPMVSAAQGNVVSPRGDFEGVAVINISPELEFDADLPDLHEIRRWVARAFYEIHPDDYDFLIIFGNFDYRMPEAMAAGNPYTATAF